MRGKIKTILYDWSGTISDDYLRAYKATVLAFSALGIRPIPIGRYRREFRLPYMDFWSRYVPDMTPDEVRKHFLIAWDRTSGMRMFDDVLPHLRELKKRGVKLGIVSSHEQSRIEKEAGFFRINGYFDFTIGTINNKTEVMAEIVRQNRLKPSETLYICDMSHDIEAAVAAAVRPVIIYRPNEKYLYEQIRDILQTKNKLNLKKLDVIGSLTELSALL